MRVCTVFGYLSKTPDTHRHDYLLLAVVLAIREGPKTGYDHIQNMDTNQILLKLHVSRQEIALEFFFPFPLPTNTFTALLQQRNTLCHNLLEKRNTHWYLKGKWGLLGLLQVKLFYIQYITLHLMQRSQSLYLLGISETTKVILKLPYNADQLMKGFVHIHWRILGTRFNISYLKKQAEIFQI